MLADLRASLGDGVQVVEDYAHAGPTPTWLRLARATLVANPEATHVLLMEDDAQPTKGFRRHATNAIEVKPDVPIGFCSVLPYEYPPGGAWVAYAKKWRCGVAVCYPRQLLIDFLAWHDSEAVKEVQPIHYVAPDALMGHYLLNVLKQPMWVTVPQLVEHGGAGQSTLGHNQREWKTQDWAGPNSERLDFQW